MRLPEITPLEVSQVFVLPVSGHWLAPPDAILLRSARLQSLERAPRTLAQPTTNFLVQQDSSHLLPFRSRSAAGQPLSNAAFASARGTISNACFFGRFFTACGSHRSGRSPTCSCLN